MWRLFCDGCDASEPRISTDLTDRQNEAVTVSISPAKTLHLCPERCAEIYWGFRADLKNIQRETMDAYYNRADDLLASLWELFRNAEKKIDQEGARAGEHSGDRGKHDGKGVDRKDSPGSESVPTPVR